MTTATTTTAGKFLDPFPYLLALVAVALVAVALVAAVVVGEEEIYGETSAFLFSISVRDEEGRSGR